MFSLLNKRAKVSESKVCGFMFNPSIEKSEYENIKKYGFFHTNISYDEQEQKLTNMVKLYHRDEFLIEFYNFVYPKKVHEMCATMAGFTTIRWTHVILDKKLEGNQECEKFYEYFLQKSPLIFLELFI